MVQQKNYLLEQNISADETCEDSEDFDSTRSIGDLKDFKQNDDLFSKIICKTNGSWRDIDIKQRFQIVIGSAIMKISNKVMEESKTKIYRDNDTE